MTTKRDIIQAAFSELGLASYDYDMQPEDYVNALRRLDNLMAEWSAQDAQTGYDLSSSPTIATIDDELSLILPLVDGVICALAVKLAPSYGKQISPDTKLTATNGFKLALKLSARPPIKRLNVTTSLSGAGNRRRGVSPIYLASETDNHADQEGNYE